MDDWLYLPTCTPTYFLAHPLRHLSTPTFSFHCSMDDSQRGVMLLPVNPPTPHLPPPPRNVSEIYFIPLGTSLPFHSVTTALDLDQAVRPWEAILLRVSWGGRGGRAAGRVRWSKTTRRLNDIVKGRGGCVEDGGPSGALQGRQCWNERDASVDS